jgi:amidase
MNVAEAAVQQLQQRMAEGEETARSLVESYLKRIEQLDRSGPTLNSVLELNPEALQLADALDAERREGHLRGPLHGIPVLLKDNIATADRMSTTAGSLALKGCIAPQDAHLVQRLREAGVIILGKTNLSEWANFRSTRSTSGWSSRGGLTRNPYALDRNPSGSSSGSAVAVSAGLCPLAVGTETDGSIISPSSACGIVGIKPTVGLVSRSGVVPISHTQDTAGPMGRSVADAALLLGAMTGLDRRDPATSDADTHGHDDYTPFFDSDGLRDARIGVARCFYGFHQRVDAIMEESLSLMQERGAQIVDPVELPGGDELGECELEVLLYEFKADLDAYLADLGAAAPVHSLAEVIAFNDRHSERVMPYFGQERMEQAHAKGPLSEPAYREALERCRRLAREEGIDAQLHEHSLDCIVAPSGAPAHVTDLVLGDHHLGGSSSPAAVAGYPSVTVPAGYVYGLPVGISFIGGAFSEPTLIRLAYAYEQASCVRRPPQFLPTAQLQEE